MLPVHSARCPKALVQFHRMPKNIVLCVDDEPIVLRTCSIALASAGFRAVVAETPTAALEAFILLHDEICVVLSDIIMPIMNGIDMAERILELDPQAKVLLMSGYGDGVTGVSESRFPLIRKPFIHSVLIERIRSVIGQADAATSTT